MFHTRTYKINSLLPPGLFTTLLLVLLFSITSHEAASQNQTDSLFNRLLPAATDNADSARDIRTDTTLAQEGKKDGESVVENLKPPQISDIVSIPKIIWSLIFLLIGYFIIRLLISLVSSLSVRYPKYDFTIKRIIPVFRILAWTLLIYIIVIGIFNPPAATLFAFFTSVGVAVGFAAQDLLKNVFGGLVVMFDRPFQIGDKIEAGKYYGEVVEIGIRSTKIVTPDDSLVTIPNSEFMVQNVSNSNSGENNCQVVAELFLPIHIDTERVREIATEAAQVSKYIYLNKPIAVLFFNEIKDRKTVLKMRLKAYVSDLSKEFYFKSEMTEIVIRSLIEQDIISEDFYKD
jgi:small-conductance mechanosensitive channel